MRFDSDYTTTIGGRGVAGAVRLNPPGERVISPANASEYGVGVSVWSANAEAVLKVGECLQSGAVWINETSHFGALAGFAGHRQSGLGGGNGIDGRLEYTNTQTILVKKG